jgi:RimJ/RimL family protein N-acetyltransferase
MPVLETTRLLVRPFTLDDLDACHQLLDIEAWQTGQSLDQRRRWLEWTVLSHEVLANLHQPPYGDRAVVLKATGEVVGSVGLVPSMAFFDRLPSFGGNASASRLRPEFGLFWATRTAHLRQGYATEAAQAVIDYVFGRMHGDRIIATTTYDNIASQGVMRRLGMSVEHNPVADPPWFQVAGVLFNPSPRSEGPWQ